MNIIPVIDIRGGVVVRATRGDRASYRPIVTPLAEGCEPAAVAGGLLRAAGSRSLYIADLDGIERGAPDLSAVRRVVEAFPHVTVWVDNGAATAEAARDLFSIEGVVAVIGSETLRDRGELARVGELAADRIALSLDFRDDAFVGLPELLDEPERWPRRVIVMTLAKVGADEGPDLARVREIVGRAGAERQVIAAGGARDVADVAALAEAGAAGVLVASALHAGKIKADDLGKIAGL